MRATPYDLDRQAMSDRAHLLARSRVYPPLFKASPDLLSYEDAPRDGSNERAHFLDCEMAVDRVVKVSIAGYRQPIQHMVQERFRGAEYSRYRDMTITEWNGNSQRGSELYKITAGWFVYGYLTPDEEDLSEVIAVPVPLLLRELPRLPVCRRPNPKGQTFLAIPFDALVERTRAELFVFR